MAKVKIEEKETAGTPFATDKERELTQEIVELQFEAGKLNQIIQDKDKEIESLKKELETIPSLGARVNMDAPTKKEIYLTILSGMSLGGFFADDKISGPEGMRRLKRYIEHASNVADNILASQRK